ncbi:MAG: hypothetical protein ABR552_11730 [Actinomycetota bacterium]
MNALECPRCGSRNVININLTVESGPVSFYSCHACEKRWWLDDAGNAMDLPEVLDKARRPSKAAKPNA